MKAPFFLLASLRSRGVSPAAMASCSTAPKFDDMLGVEPGPLHETDKERAAMERIAEKPAGAPDPKAPAFLEVSRTWARVESAASLAGGPAGPDRDRAAREAYYSGDPARALTLAPAAGNAWIAGLSAWRMGRYEEARGFFRAVAVDETEDEWLRAGGAFWAARASRALGDTAQAAAFLRMAAKTPHSFYGMIAQRALELDGARLGALDGWTAPGASPLLVRASTAPRLASRAFSTDSRPCQAIADRMAMAKIATSTSTSVNPRVKRRRLASAFIGVPARWTASPAAGRLRWRPRRRHA
jgi:hypothetical protein